jgi:hypothetical protein
MSSQRFPTRTGGQSSDDSRPDRPRIFYFAASFPMSLTGVCKHVRVLERSGLARRTRRGRENTLEFTAKPLRDVARGILLYERFWNARLDGSQT